MVAEGSMDYWEVAEKSVFLEELCLGKVCGQRNLPDTENLHSFRLRLDPDVASQFLRKPAAVVPIDRELLSTSDDGLRVVKSGRELRRRWRNTVMVGNELYSPDELESRAVLDSNGIEIGEIEAVIKVKRTFKCIRVRTRRAVQEELGMGEVIYLPVDIMVTTRDLMDEVILNRPAERLGNSMMESSLFTEGIALPATR